MLECALRLFLKRLRAVVQINIPSLIVRSKKQIKKDGVFLGGFFEGWEESVCWGFVLFCMYVCAGFNMAVQNLLLA